ncbi:MAG: HlyD family efflux transporter periplasmic adaptor subunit [Scytonema sp. CRU_2_7]|nr:HlyD family efflux transporter periplasmic adaptor subunit [Scytonema sp. CRU_2_7]
MSQVDEVAVAHGKLIPGEQDVQPVRSPSSGKIKYINEIKVKEGQPVQKGDILVRLDSESSQVNIESLNQQAQSIQQDMESQGRAADAKLREAEIELSGLQSQLVLAQAKAKRLERAFGAIPLETIRDAQQQVSELVIRITAKKQNIQQIQQNNRSEMSRLLEKFQSVKGQLKQAELQNKNQMITAPISGIVYNIKVNPSQGTVQSGEELLSILPEGKEPLLEVDLPNQYRGFVDEKMNAKVKIDAFPYQEYGVIEGTVISVSPYAVVKDKNSGKEVYPTRAEGNPRLKTWD